MAPYTMNSDEIFLRCFDKQTIEVYELDNLHFSPLKGKNSEYLTSIATGPGAPYSSLKIGVKELNDTDFTKLVQDLYDSRLMVNREGLCFAATTGITSERFGVEFYRMFDIFDWSNYQVKASVNTVWTRKDIKEGGPITINHGATMEEFEKKLEEEKLKHKLELEEAQHKHEEELKIKLDKKQEEIDDLKRKNKELEIDITKKNEKFEKKLKEKKLKHKLELEEAKRKQDQIQEEIEALLKKLKDEERKQKEELRLQQAMIDDLKRKNKELLIDIAKNNEMFEKKLEEKKLKHKLVLEEAKRKQDKIQEEIEAVLKKLKDEERKQKEELRLQQAMMDDLKRRNNELEIAIAENNEEFEKKLEEEKLKHKLVLEEAKRKQDKIQEEIEALLKKLKDEDSKKIEEMRLQQAMIDDLKRRNNELEIAIAENNEELVDKNQIAYLESELKVRSFEWSKLQGWEYCGGIINHFRIKYPSEKFIVSSSITDKLSRPVYDIAQSRVVMPLDIKLTAKSALEVGIEPVTFDTDNWFLIKGIGNDDTHEYACIYYDGNFGEINNCSIPTTRESYDQLSHRFMIRFVMGVGLRFSQILFYGDY